VSSRVAFVLIFLAGFVSLSLEILLVRLYRVLSGSLPEVFGIVLGLYLIGIAYGARICKTERPGGVPQVAERVSLLFVLLSAGTFFYFSFAAAVSGLGPSAFYVPLVLFLPMPVMSGVLFPLLIRAGAGNEEVSGRRIGALLTSNIIGCMAGSLVTGLLLLEYLTLASSILVVTTLGLLGAVVAERAVGVHHHRRVVYVAVACLLLYLPLYGRFAEHLYSAIGEGPLAYSIENKSGIIFVGEDGAVFGDGVYDGHVDISPGRGENRIFRAFSAFCLNRDPRRILAIGLGSGSWAQVMVNAPGVESLKVVEINPGYREVVERSEAVRSLLKNPKFSLDVADGRQWLQRNADQQFDLILLNTAIPHRSNATNLISVEFLRSVQKHLLPRGMIYINWAYSYPVLRTVASAFSEVAVVQNFAFGSHEPILYERRKCHQLYENFRIDDKPVLETVRDNELINRLVSLPIRGDQEEILALTAGREIVTEDNLVTEYPGVFASRDFDPVPEFY
jgi:predicted membrane-bound spermidine synthase